MGHIREREVKVGRMTRDMSTVGTQDVKANTSTHVRLIYHSFGNNRGRTEALIADARFPRSRNDGQSRVKNGKVLLERRNTYMSKPGKYELHCRNHQGI